jgi:predicted nucleic acid-binding protein
LEWVTNLKGKTIGLDTAPLIYLIEEHPIYLEAILTFFEAVERGEVTAVTSTVTLLEVLVHPFRNNNNELATEYRDILLHSKVITSDVSAPIAEAAAQLRSRHNIRTPDAIQIAAAMHAGATHFLTNDARLPAIPSLTILVLDDVIRVAKM